MTDFREASPPRTPINPQPPPTRTPRIPPGTWREVGLAKWLFARLAGHVTRTQPPAVFTILGRTGTTFWGWLLYSAALMPGGKLSRYHTELVILTVAELRQCAYEWHHHVRLGRKAGVTSAQLRRIQDRRFDTEWTPTEAALLAAVNQLVTERQISQHHWDELAGFFTHRQLIELLLVTSHYDGLATTLLALQVNPDEPR